MIAKVSEWSLVWQARHRSSLGCGVGIATLLGVRAWRLPGPWQTSHWTLRRSGPAAGGGALVAVARCHCAAVHRFEPPGASKPVTWQPMLTEIGVERLLWPLSGAQWPKRTGVADVTGVKVHPLGSALALRAPAEEWQKFWSSRPPPGSNDLMALIKRRVLKAEGDLHVFMANLRYFKEALAKLRAGQAA